MVMGPRRRWDRGGKPSREESSGGVVTADLPSVGPSVRIPPPLILNVDGDAKTAEDRKAMYEAAKREFAEGRFVEAERKWERLCELEPLNGKVWVSRVGCLVTLKKYNRARTVLRRALSILPTNAIIWQRWADLEKGLGHLDLARKLFERAYEANPRLPSLYNSWGSMECKRGNISAARKLFAIGLRYDPDNARLCFSAAVLEDRRGNTIGARELFCRGIAADETNPYLLQGLAVLEFKQGNISEARETIKKAVKCSPDHTLSWLSWAQMEEIQGNVDKARKVYKDGCKSSKGIGAVQLWQGLARLEEKAGQMREALEILHNASKNFPDDQILYCTIGELLERRGDAEQARRAYFKGISLDESFPYLYQRLAALEESQFREDHARDIYRLGSLKGKGIERAALLHAWAVFEWKRGNREMAHERFKEAVIDDPNCGWLWMWFGRFTAEEKNEKSRTLARHYFSRSINADPSDSAPWKALGELERMTGNEARARYYYKRAAELDNRRALYTMDPERPLARPWRSAKDPSSTSKVKVRGFAESLIAHRTPVTDLDEDEHGFPWNVNNVVSSREGPDA